MLHLDKIQDIVKEAHTAQMRQYDVSAEVFNEKHIYKTYGQAFSKYNKRCLDVAKFPCISCDKLCFKREFSQVNRLRSVPCNRNWDILFEFIEGGQILMMVFRLVTSAITVCNIIDLIKCPHDAF